MATTPDLDLLWRAVQMEADMAAIDGANVPGMTMAKLVEGSVRAAFETAAENNLITINDPDGWPFLIERRKP